MVGTKEGGRKAAITNRRKYGPDFYKINGRKGGQNGHTGGFAAMSKERLKEISAKGGRNGSNAGRRWKQKRSKE